jgi:hypothetical protein
MREMKEIRRSRREARLARRRGEVPADGFEEKLAAALSSPLNVKLPPLRFVLGAKMLGGSLDNKLANGAAPESHPLLAERAATLADPKWRDQLAEAWLKLLTSVPEPFNRFSTTVGLNHRMIRACEDELRLLAEQLRRGLVSVRGVAMAHTLLMDGSGPVYNPSSSHDLGALIMDVIRFLDPTYRPQGEFRWLA